MFAQKLQKGDTIGIIAPSSCIRDDQKQHLESFKVKLEELGFKVKYSKHLFGKDKYKVSCGSGKERAEDLNSMVLDKDIKAIWCFQGGDTANEMLEYIDYGAIKKHPKIFLGKSDVDVLLLAIYKMTGLITFHCCDAKLGNKREFDYEYTQQMLQKRLMESKKEITASGSRICLRKGKATGKIIGCNDSSILKLNGTKYFPDFENAILFLEAYKPDIKRVIYRLTQFKQIGILDKIKGIVIGHIFKFDSGENKVTYEEMVDELTKEYNFPILKIEEFGHYCPHTCLPIGATVELDATNKQLKIVDDFLKNKK